MAQRKIIWTETAARQRRSILEYWLDRNLSPTYSIKLLQLSNDKADRIAENPFIYKTSEFPDTRVAAMGILVCPIKSKKIRSSLQPFGIIGKIRESY